MLLLVRREHLFALRQAVKHWVLFLVLLLLEWELGLCLAVYRVPPSQAGEGKF